MRILIYAEHYYPRGNAAAKRTKVMADTFMSLGHEVVVVTNSSDQEHLAPDAVKEKVIYRYSSKLGNKSTLRRLFNNLTFASSSKKKLKEYGEVDAVVVVAPPPLISYAGRKIARRKKAVLIYDIRDIWPDVAVEMGAFSKRSIFYKVFNRITKSMCKSADLVSVVTPSKVDNIKAKLEGKIDDKVKLFSNGLDETFLNLPEDSELVSKYGMDDYFTISYVGNIGHAQNLDCLLDFAKTVAPEKKVKILLFGPGAESKRIQARIEDEKIENACLCGPVPHQQTYSILKHSKLAFVSLVNANLKDSIPTKIYEALGAGCPVLLVAEGDSVKVVEESKFGVSISPNEIEKLPQAFDEIYNNYDELMKNKEFAKNLMIEKYSRQQVSRELAKEIERLVEDKKQGEKKV